MQEYEKYEGKLKNFEKEFDEPYKELVSINASWWHMSKQATYCTVCKENCHYPGCWWVNNLSWCSVMSNEGKCTVCSGKCDHTEHVKDNKIYEIKTRKITKTDKDLKKKFDEYKEKKSLMSNLKSEIEKFKEEKIRFVEECYHCLEKLMETALKSTSMSCFIHLELMIERLKETGNQERVKKLEELKKKAEVENPGLLRSAWMYVNSR
ncbi:uncharacterized protein LOC130548404 [Triplophysa rosa]|uniref:uncharacterized protein LOC130548404 n=1 Tax=Triplophysa rosa TaxID=992332 RepID=UPI002545CD22|nr:uncharacterized protein LOC130548404 [Triplophysa rosa]